MAATGFTSLRIYASSTPSAVPAANNLDNTDGAELAINIADGKLFYKDSSGTVQVLAKKSIADLDALTGLLIGNGSSISTVTAPTGTIVGTTDTQTLTNKTVSGLTINDGYTEEVYAVVDAAGVALSPTNGSIQTWTLGANRTPTAGTWASGQSMTLMIDDGSAYTVTWTTLGVVWETSAGSAPTLATTGYTAIVLWKVGTTIYGAAVGV